MTAAAIALKNVYTPQEFSDEILCGKLSVWWVRDQIAAKKIKVMTKRPMLIPQSEALRFINGGAK